MPLLPRLALAMAAIWLAGCGQPGRLSRDEKVAARQINELLPKGASESRAMRALTENGFTLSRLDSRDASNHLVVASQVRDTTFWQVGVVIVDAKVASTTVKITDLARTPK